MRSLFALADDISAGLGREENCRITLYGALSTDFVMQYVLRLRICAFGRYRNCYQPCNAYSSKSLHQCLTLCVFKWRILGRFLPRIVFCVPDVSCSIYIQPSTHFFISYLFRTVGLFGLLMSLFQGYSPHEVIFYPAVSL